MFSRYPCKIFKEIFEVNTLVESVKSLMKDRQTNRKWTDKKRMPRKGLMTNIEY